MDAIRPDQFVTLFLFMAVLGLGWLVVRINKGGLVRRIAGERRIKLAEVTALSPSDRAMILAVDGQEFLVLRCKGAAPVLQALPKREVPSLDGLSLDGPSLDGPSLDGPEVAA